MSDDTRKVAFSSLTILSAEKKERVVPEVAFDMTIFYAGDEAAGRGTMEITLQVPPSRETEQLKDHPEHGKAYFGMMQEIVRGYVEGSMRQSGFVGEEPLEITRADARGVTLKAHDVDLDKFRPITGRGMDVLGTYVMNQHRVAMPKKEEKEPALGGSKPIGTQQQDIGIGV